ncbi:MAG: hypothetical protein ACTHNK_14240, partial [Thermomicrobiales bacterium]
MLFRLKALIRLQYRKTRYSGKDRASPYLLAPQTRMKCDGAGERVRLPPIALVDADDYLPAPFALNAVAM